MTLDQYKNDMKVSSGLQELILPGQDMPKYLDFFNDRVTVEMDKIVKLLEGQCVEIGWLKSWGGFVVDNSYM